MDLSQFDSLQQAQEDGIDVDITHPKTQERIGIVFRVAGIDSERMRKARHAVSGARLKTGKLQSVTPDQLEQEGLDYLVASVISWSWDKAVPATEKTPAIPATTLDGKVPEFNEKNVRAVLKRYPFIRVQIDSVVGDRAGFMKD